MKSSPSGVQSTARTSAATTGNRPISAGFVYVITNRAWPEWVKCGHAISADKRLARYQTYSPMRDFVLVASVPFTNSRAGEFECHLELARRAHERRGEWFRMNAQAAARVITRVGRRVESQKEI
ncbi:GIY-YIG nuclease family protein [Parvibaculum sp.]|uniref:GIY-YIG nuclease family protein n=1 Tax=Parvibaculum sp. TaxID=2024848 RepID=UPI00351DE48C